MRIINLSCSSTCAKPRGNSNPTTADIPARDLIPCGYWGGCLSEMITFCQTPKGTTLMLVSWTLLCSRFLSHGSREKLTQQQKKKAIKTQRERLTRTRAGMCRLHRLVCPASFPTRSSGWGSWKRPRTTYMYVRVEKNNIK